MHGFTDEERERIREELIETGRELLLVYGPQKTTVSDITEPVGIAKPTFYRFFDAKADLYLVIFRREMAEYVERVRSDLTDVEDPREALERFFRRYVEFAEGNEFIQQVVVRGNYRETFRGASSSAFEDVQREGVAELLPFIEELRERSDGPLSDVEPFTLLGLMGGSMGLLATHKEEFEGYDEEFGYSETFGYDDGYYRRLQELLISSLARGLTAEETRSTP